MASTLTSSVAQPTPTAVLAVLHQLVEPLWRALPQPCEVVLHDLRLIPNSVVAIAGDVTGRKVGDPATDLLLAKARAGRVTSEIGYTSALEDGTPLRSSTIVVDADAGPIAALCINVDVTRWTAAFEAMGSFLGGLFPGVAVTPGGRGQLGLASETFPRGVDELASSLVSRAIAHVGVPVDLMKKAHKLAVVAELEDGGYFMVKEAVESLAEALGVTRFTIYNYLNELRGDASG